MNVHLICDGFGITLLQFFAENEIVELIPELVAIDGTVFLLNIFAKVDSDNSQFTTSLYTEQPRSASRCLNLL